MREFSGDVHVAVAEGLPWERLPSLRELSGECP